MKDAFGVEISKADKKPARGLNAAGAVTAGAGATGVAIGSLKTKAQQKRNPQSFRPMEPFKNRNFAQRTAANMGFNKAKPLPPLPEHEALSFKKISRAKTGSAIIGLAGVGMMYEAHRKRIQQQYAQPPTPPVQTKVNVPIGKAHDDIARSKRNQARLGTAAASLGVAALGARGTGAGLRAAGRRGMVLRRVQTAANLSHMAGKADRASENLGIAAVGVGGASGFHMASINRKEGRKR